MAYLSRAAAGRELGRFLAGCGLRVDVVLGLPRGGVVVAAEVARILQCPLEALVVRKIGHPRHPEFAVGALAEHGIVLLDQDVLKRHHVTQAELDVVVAAETGRLRAHQSRFHPCGEPNLSGRSVLLIDDGLATGATTEAAVLSAKKQLAATVAVASPVASTHAVQRLGAIADNVFALISDPDFMAVGQYYDEFPQTSDEEVVALLRRDAVPKAGIEDTGV